MRRYLLASGALIVAAPLISGCVAPAMQSDGDDPRYSPGWFHEAPPAPPIAAVPYPDNGGVDDPAPPPRRHPRQPSVTTQPDEPPVADLPPRPPPATESPETAPPIARPSPPRSPSPPVPAGSSSNQCGWWDAICFIVKGKAT